MSIAVPLTPGPGFARRAHTVLTGSPVGPWI